MKDGAEARGIAGAVAIPIAFGVVSVIVLVVAAGDRGLFRVVVDAGRAGWMTLACGGSAFLALAILGVLVRLGSRVPAVAFFAVALAPMGMAAPLMNVGVARVGAVLDRAPVDELRVLAARGLVEALGGRLVGAVLSAALLSAVAITFAIAARREPEPASRAARGVALAAAAGLVLVTAVAASTTHGLVEALQAIIEARGKAESTPRVLRALARFEPWAPLVACVPPAVALLRVRAPSRGAILSAIAIVLVAFVVVRVDAQTIRIAAGMVGRHLRLPWEDVADFTPIRYSKAGLGPERIDGVVGRGSIRARLGRPVSTDDAPAMQRLFVRLIRTPPPEPPPPEDEEVPEWLVDAGPRDARGKRPRTDPDPYVEKVRAREEAKTSGILDVIALPRGMGWGRPLCVAVDARIGGATLRRVLSSAERAHVWAVDLVGVVDVPGARRRPSGIPLLAPFERPVLARESVFLTTAMSPYAADRDPFLWHGEISSGSIVLMPRAGAGVPIALGAAPERTPAIARRAVYLRLGRDTTVGELARAAHRVRSARGWPILVLDELPGHPESPARSD